ncbi:hypothetical protein EYF80_005449 [Liparis tanakae]|uniref:Uncharacterized protein n=1 Tax=Liparis tanakae TaxID=230148 RepID=A0A4Z2J3T8_9TELE|nr:hypothetical protein EYF80_005449 [Liparis tanakae]
MKKEAAADEEGDGEPCVLAPPAAWSPGWLELLSRQGVEASAVASPTGASEAAASASASPIEPYGDQTAYKCRSSCPPPSFRSIDATDGPTAAAAGAG